MRWSGYFAPTLKENPQEALIKSHRFMIRAGLVRKLASGTYSYLPLGLRALSKTVQIVREEMDKAGSLEVLLPALHPAELWKETGRYEILGDDMIHFKDRHGKENVLGPTHEEVITDLVRREIRSYRQLPLILYQIQTKFRDEMRPRSGVIRSREFLMKDAYSFHATAESLDETYHRMKKTYENIFRRCGLDFHIVKADPGAMGGSGSQEFVLFSEAGEDRVVQIGDGGEVMSVEMAERKIAGTIPVKPPAGGKFKKVQTPGHSSVEGVAQFLKKAPKDLVKTMIYEIQDKFFAVLIRGDHEASDYKIKKFIDKAAHLASRDAIDRLKTAFGFSGPIGLDLPLYVDEDVLAMKDFVTGANEADCHLVDVNLADFIHEAARIRVGDFRQIVEGDKSPEGKPLRFQTAIELGHIFKLNLRYSEPMKAVFLDEKGKGHPLVMGCYGIGVNRILAAAIEQYADDKGIVWPKTISPFQVLVIMVDESDAQTQELARLIESSRELAAKGADILVDDRRESPGVKFNDADLIGFPLRVVLGPKNLKIGKAEIKIRKTGEIVLTDLPNLLPEILKQLDKIR